MYFLLVYWVDYIWIKVNEKNRIEQVIIAFLSPEYFSITDEK